MHRVALLLLLSLLSFYFSSPICAETLVPLRLHKSALRLPVYHSMDTARNRADTLAKDSVSTPKDSIPQYTIIVDTVKTYPFNQDSLNHINVRQVKRFARPASRLHIFQIADDYCLYRPKYWSNSVDASLTVTEASFSKNWKAGGTTNSLSILSSVNAKASYERYDVSWTNELQSQLGEAATVGIQGLRKTADRLYLDSKFAVKLRNAFFLFSAVNFQSQFLSGNNYEVDSLGVNRKLKVSGFLSPGYLTESIGLEFKPKPYFSLRLGIGSFRQTFVIDTSIYHNSSGNYGVPVGERSLTEGAVQIIGNFDKDLVKNLHLTALLQLTQGYTSSSNTSGRLDLTLTGKVSKLLIANFTGTGLYDRSQDTRIQFTQFLSLGVAYKFSDF